MRHKVISINAVWKSTGCTGSLSEKNMVTLQYFFFLSFNRFQTPGNTCWKVPYNLLCCSPNTQWQASTDIITIICMIIRLADMTDITSALQNNSAKWMPTCRVLWGETTDTQTVLPPCCLPNLLWQRQDLIHFLERGERNKDSLTAAVNMQM